MKAKEHACSQTVSCSWRVQESNIQELEGIRYSSGIVVGERDVVSSFILQQSFTDLTAVLGNWTPAY